VVRGKDVNLTIQNNMQGAARAPLDGMPTKADPAFGCGTPPTRKASMPQADKRMSNKGSTSAP